MPVAKLVSLDNLERFRSNMAASVWESIAEAADGTTITFDAEQRKLSASGGGSDVSEIISYAANGELDDVKTRAGSFSNAGAGWNTFTFPDPFEDVPTVVCQCDGYDVEVKTVTAESFLYRVVSLSVSSNSWTVFTTNISAVTSVEMATVSEAVTVRYMAVEYGGG